MQTPKILGALFALLFCATALRAEQKDIAIELTVPDSAWIITIDEVHRVKNELWVVSTVSRDPNMMGAQVISTVRASVKLAATDLPVKHFVIGKTWGWKNNEPYTFLKNTKDIEKDLKSAKILFRKLKKKSQ